VEYLLGVIIVGCAGLLAWAAFRIEPHWCSKDGSRMIAQAQQLSQTNRTAARWSEVRVSVDEDAVVVRTRAMRSTGLRGEYRVVGKSPTPPKKQEIYVLRGDQEVLIRIPKSSRAIMTFDELLNGNS
jgi:hypothetical protein